MNRIFPRNRRGDDLWLPMAIILFATAIARAGSADVGTPAIGPNGMVHFKVTGKYRTNKIAAHENALREAQDQLRMWLVLQNPPINSEPSLDSIRREMVRNTTEQTHDSNLDDDGQTERGLNLGKMYFVTLDVELSPAHIRALRARDRCLSGFWLLGEIMAFLGVTVLFFRFEDWTKGYLTRYLFVGSAIVLCAVLALIRWVK